MKKYLLTAIALLIIIIIGYLFLGSGDGGRDIPTAKVSKGELVVSLTENGTLAAKRSVSISAPRIRGNLLIVKLVPEGTMVKAGDFLIQFDPTEQETKLRDAQAELKIAEANLQRAVAQYDMDAKQLKLAAKQVATWVKKNPNTPLLLMTSIRRADLPGKLNRSPIDVPGEVQASKLIRRVDPVYPEAAKRARMSGRVVLTVGIDEQGNVEEITVKSGHPLLAAASIIAVQQWKYSPLLINGEPFPVVATVTTVFNVK